MPQSIRIPGEFSPGTSGARDSSNERLDVKAGTMFVRPSMFLSLPESVHLAVAPHQYWMMVSGADPGETTQKLIRAGWIFSVGSPIEGSAFGCDSEVLERAVNRALQKATDGDHDCVEITGVELDQHSGLDYVSLFARVMTLRREPALNLAGGL